MENEFHTQVLVVGAGNAGMSAALAAHQSGVEVIILERAPKEFRGGNSSLTGGMRFPYNSVEDIVPVVTNMSEDQVRRLMGEWQPRYTQADFYDDVMHVTDGQSDPELLDILVREAYPTVRWLRTFGHGWEPRLAGADEADGSLSMNGGGGGLQERNFAICEQLGINIRYETRARELLQDNKGAIVGVRAWGPDGFINYRAKAVVLSCGGFEGNPEMRARYLGPYWDVVKMRGVPFNTGDGLNMALQIGALPYGSWSSCHASPQDLNRPVYSLPGLAKGAWNRYVYPFSVMVDVNGQRFVDEGEDFRRLTYAKMGRMILAQRGRMAFQILDAKGREHKVYPKHYDARATRVEASTLESLAEKLGVNAAGLVRTVKEFNAAVQPGKYDPLVRDGKTTAGISPPKSNWALPIDKPPFEGFPVCCGITFSFGGLRINSKAQVIHTLDRPIPGLYAAGEMVGGLWHWSYPSGGGMMAGAVFGKIAGSNAAAQCKG